LNAFPNPENVFLTLIKGKLDFENPPFLAKEIFFKKRNKSGI